MDPLKQALRVELRDEERTLLRKIVAERIASPSRIRRAEILLSLDAHPTGGDVAPIAALHQVTPYTVNRISSRYHKYGLRTAVLATRLPHYVVLSDSERLLLHDTLNDPKSTKRNVKVARILLRAEADGENADATRIADCHGISLTMVARTLQLYGKSGLNDLLDRPPRPLMLRFQLSAKDRKTLNDLLKLETERGWKRNRILVLLKSDQGGPNVNLNDISESTGVCVAAVRKMCTDYMESGLDITLSYRTVRPAGSRRPFPVRLSAEERRKLQRLSEGNCPKQIKQRAVVLLNADLNVSDKSNKEIMAIAGVCNYVVSETCKRFAQHGLEQALSARLYKSSSGDLLRLPKIRSKFRTSIDNRRIAPVPLTSQERMVLQKIIEETKNSKERMRRAQVLLKIDEFGGSRSFREIAELVGVSHLTVSRIYRRYRERGVYHAVDHKNMRNPTRAFLLDARQESRIIKMFEGCPPKDCERWTFKILAEQAVARKIVPAISRETVRKVLRKRNALTQR